MVPLHTLGLSFFRALPLVIRSPFFYIVIVLIIVQYSRAAELEKKLWGRPRYSVARQVILSLIFGVIGGFLGSLLLMGVGVALSGNWMIYVWVVALSLAFVSARLMCFAYAGGIVATSALLLGWPQIDVSSLLALVALLHAVESVLMFMSGHLGATPVNIKNLHGDIVGGFSLQKFWPVPLLALFLIPEALPMDVGSITMPNWWPLIMPSTTSIHFSFWMIPVVAGLGYGELAISTSPRRRAKESAVKLALYSICLFVIAYLSTHSRAFLFIGAIFAPLGHELLVWTTNRREMGGRPLFPGTSTGLQILDVMPHSPAARAGIKRGDIIHEADGKAIACVSSLEAALVQGAGQVSIITDHGQRFLAPQTLRETGLIPVPGDDTHMYLETKFASPLDYLARIIGR